VGRIDERGASGTLSTTLLSFVFFFLLSIGGWAPGTYGDAAHSARFRFVARHVTEHELVDAYLKSSNCELRNHWSWSRLSSPRPFEILRVQATSDRPVRTIEYPPTPGSQDSHSTLLSELWKQPTQARARALFVKTGVASKF
jgi:hypothetical protein